LHLCLLTRTIEVGVIGPLSINSAIELTARIPARGRPLAIREGTTVSNAPLKKDDIGSDRFAVSHKSVLLVDDDLPFARAVVRVLTASDFEVTVVHSGAAAAEALAVRPFDAIVSDIQMPGMSGVELLSRVRQHDLDVPVILLTAAPTIETAMEAVSLGALQYFAKPVSNEVLVNAVERACQLHRVARMKREALKLLGQADDQAGDRAGLQSCFDRALQTMWMAFQPIVDLDRRRLFGYEALVRSDEPSLPHPGGIIGAAERLGRVAELGGHIRVLAAQAFLNAPADQVLFVNLHARDLLDSNLYSADAPLTKLAERVVLEITERAALDEIPDVRASIGALRSLGFRIAIDDLGAGYAGLASFAALEPDIVKLDMSLVRNVHQSAIRQRVVRSMTSLCKDMGMGVISEGIEVAEERDAVLGFGCSLLQGYFFAKPGRPFPMPQNL
jgi:EAL domain-containing protein (putative c-di-GMP-specific phosphodiesterase class I)